MPSQEKELTHCRLFHANRPLKIILIWKLKLPFLVLSTTISLILALNSKCNCCILFPYFLSAANCKWIRLPYVCFQVFRNYFAYGDMPAHAVRTFTVVDNVDDVEHFQKKSYIHVQVINILCQLYTYRECSVIAFLLENWAI